MTIEAEFKLESGLLGWVCDYRRIRAVICYSVFLEEFFGAFFVHVGYWMERELVL